MPEPPRPLCPAEAWENLGKVGPSNVSCPPSSSPPCPVPHLSLFPSCPKMKTQPNSFGLFCLYDEGLLPIYNPETENLLDEVGPFLACESSSRLNEGITDPSNPFHPYPNKTSLLLGDWYWNQGHKKSQVGFKQLLDIIRDPEYHPKNVQNMNWMAINQNLGNSSIQDDKIKANCEWSDSGWKNTTVQICTPFHHRAWHTAQRSTVLRAFIITAWWISFTRMYQIPLTIDSSIMCPTNSTGSCHIRPRM